MYARTSVTNVDPQGVLNLTVATPLQVEKEVCMRSPPVPKTEIQADRDPAAGRRELDGVLDQVGDDMLQFQSVHADPRLPGRGYELVGNRLLHRQRRPVVE